MALKFVQTGGGTGGSGSGTYDHNLLVNRGMTDQHTIESITGLRTVLDKKYEKPFSGIPKTDLAFNVATLHDIDVFRKTDLADVINDLSAIALEVGDARGGLNTLREYIDSKVSYADWSGNGGVGSGGGHVDSQVGYPLYEEYVSASGQTTFPLTKTYLMGSHQLEVYVDGLRMLEGDDYRESDDHTVEFLWGMEGGERVLFMVRAVINSGLHEEYVATLAQRVFTLQAPYGIYQNILQVYRNGVLQRKGRDYREIDDVTIEFVYDLVEGDLVTFHQAGATDPIAGTILESEIGRMKINYVHTTMMLHDATQTEKTDYLDMYVDTFITELSLSPLSTEYLYEEQSIMVNYLQRVISTIDEFEEGVVTDTDIHTYPNDITLKNLSGGAEAHSFGLPVKVIATTINEAVSFYNNRREFFYFYAEELASGQCILRMKQGEIITDLNSSDGSFFGLSASQDSKGNIHLVYHEQGSVSGKAKIHYLLWNAESQAILDSLTLSDTTQDAIRPDIFVDREDTAHVVFASKRINASVFNIDYRTIKDGLLSGFKDITVYSTMDALNPRIVVGSDLKARVVYESINYDGATKNIRFTVLNNGVREYSDWLTQSTTYENTMPDIAIDSLDNASVVWKSKRLGTTFGVDFTLVSASNVPSPVRAVATGTFTCDYPKVGVDYENISHVVFNANLVRDDHQNIVYSYVYPDGSVSPLESIAAEFGIQFTDPRPVAYGDRVVVSFMGDSTGYQLEKSLANYTSVGKFDYVYDSKAEQSVWNGLVGTRIDAHAQGTATLQCRASDDQVIWTSWVDAVSLGNNPLVGRYLHIRVTLSSTDANITPIVTDIAAMYRPAFIEIQSTSKSSSKDVDAAILIARYEGDIDFYVSRDGGTTFFQGELETAINLLMQPQGRDVVIKAKIFDGSRLSAWGVVW